MATEDLIPVHIGLMGHIDAGKTAIARNLSAVVSTAGLDKHPQSQVRGITIDLGFTFFPLKEYLVTLVDAPGHADLIRSVVSSASIIDMGILVIDGTEGPQVQTGEHLLILDITNIPELVVIINKTDIIDAAQLQKVTSQITSILKTTRFGAGTKIFPVSAKNGEGFELVKDHIHAYFQSHPIHRVADPPFKFAFDHHFNKKGVGTILTGTVLSGNAKIGTELTILPTNVKTKIKSIQKSKATVESIRAGDRCGISVSEIGPQQVYRGCIATDGSENFTKGNIIDVDVDELAIFQPVTKFGLQITATLGMLTLNANIFPYIIEIQNKSSFRVRLDEAPKKQQYGAIIRFTEDIYLQPGDHILLTRLDLSPKSLRILGSATVKGILSALPQYYRHKIKQGKVKNPTYGTDEVVVEGLAQSLAGAQSLLEKTAEAPYGKVVKTFGKNGNLIIKKSLQENPETATTVGDPVEILLYKEVNIKN